MFPVYVILTNTLHIHGIKERKTIERVQREPGQVPYTKVHVHQTKHRKKSNQKAKEYINLIGIQSIQDKLSTSMHYQSKSMQTTRKKEQVTSKSKTRTYGHKQDAICMKYRDCSSFKDNGKNKGSNQEEGAKGRTTQAPYGHKRLWQSKSNESLSRNQCRQRTLIRKQKVKNSNCRIGIGSRIVSQLNSEYA